MIKSMTGYGHGANRENGIEVAVEVRSVNNRFLDLVIKVPKVLAEYEQKIRDLISQSIARGRVNVWISIEGEEVQYQNLKLNKELARAYVRLAKEAKEELQIEGSLTPTDLFAMQDIIQLEEKTDIDDKTWQCTETTINQALSEMNKMRIMEGEAIRIDFDERISNLEEHIQKIEALSASRPSEELDKLRSRVQKLIKNEQIDENRLELELALIADRLDLSEECVRFHSHNNLFTNMLDNEESSGRKLNFLLQEMNREANTIGAKASSSEISHLVVEIKEEVERIREQVQNVE